MAPILVQNIIIEACFRVMIIPSFVGIFKPKGNIPAIDRESIVVPKYIPNLLSDPTKIKKRQLKIYPYKLIFSKMSDENFKIKYINRILPIVINDQNIPVVKAASSGSMIYSFIE